MGEIAHEIGAEHLGVLQLLGHFVEAVGDHPEGGMIPQGLAEGDPGPEIPPGQPVHLGHQPVHGPQEDQAGEGRDHGPQHHADQGHEHHHLVGLPMAEKARPGQHRHHHGGNAHGQHLHDENHRRGQQGQRQAVGPLLPFHTFFTAL